MPAKFYTCSRQRCGRSFLAWILWLPVTRVLENCYFSNLKTNYPFIFLPNVACVQPKSRKPLELYSFSSCRWGSNGHSAIRWISGGPQLRKEEARTWTDSDLAGKFLYFFILCFLSPALSFAQVLSYFSGPIGIGCPVEGQGLHPGYRHVQLQVWWLHRGAGRHQQVGHLSLSSSVHTCLLPVGTYPLNSCLLLFFFFMPTSCSHLLLFPLFRLFVFSPSSLLTLVLLSFPFLLCLSISLRLMQVGEEFCGSKSEVLQESIKRQSVNYFKHYHRWAPPAGRSCGWIVPCWASAVAGQK